MSTTIDPQDARDLYEQLKRLRTTIDRVVKDPAAARECDAEPMNSLSHVAYYAYEAELHLENLVHQPVRTDQSGPA